MDRFWVARDAPRIDAKCGDHFLQADLSVLIRLMPIWITSCLPTNRPESSELLRIGRQKRWENPRPSFSLGPPRFGGIPERGISRLAVQC